MLLNQCGDFASQKEKVISEVTRSKNNQIVSDIMTVNTSIIKNYDVNAINYKFRTEYIGENSQKSNKEHEKKPFVQ